MKKTVTTWRQWEICPLIAANHFALAEFFHFLRNIPPFRWLNSAKIKKLCNANTMNKDYSGARRCIMPNISQCLNILLLVTALVIGWRVACWPMSSLETKALLYL